MKKELRLIFLLFLFDIAVEDFHCFFQCQAAGAGTIPDLGAYCFAFANEMFDIIEVCKEQMGVDYEEYEAL